MCRNIRNLFNFEPPVTDDEVYAASLQFVRKISGFAKPSKANEPAFLAAVDEIAALSAKYLRSLETNAPPKNREEEAAKKKELAGVITASWGDQMRSYFLYGQQLVKDLRTGYEVGNPAVVFDGELDGFISAGIRWRKSSGAL